MTVSVSISVINYIDEDINITITMTITMTISVTMLLQYPHHFSLTVHQEFDAGSEIGQQAWGHVLKEVVSSEEEVWHVLLIQKYAEPL